MTAITFPQANINFARPKDLEESQCSGLHGYGGQIRGGTLDGCPIIVTAWKPNAYELAQLNAGEPVFIGMLTEVLPPCCVSVRFDLVSNPG